MKHLNETKWRNNKRSQRAYRRSIFNRKFYTFFVPEYTQKAKIFQHKNPSKIASPRFFPLTMSPFYVQRFLISSGKKAKKNSWQHAVSFACAFHFWNEIESKQWNTQSLHQTRFYWMTNTFTHKWNFRFIECVNRKLHWKRNH